MQIIFFINNIKFKKIKNEKLTKIKNQWLELKDKFKFLK